MKRIQSLLAILLVIGLVFGVTYQADAQARNSTVKTATSYTLHTARDSAAAPGNKTSYDITIRIDSCARGEKLIFYTDAVTSGNGYVIATMDTTLAPVTIYGLKSDYVKFKSTTGTVKKTVNTVAR